MSAPFGSQNAAAGRFGMHLKEFQLTSEFAMVAFGGFFALCLNMPEGRLLSPMRCRKFVVTARDCYHRANRLQKRGAV